LSQPADLIAVRTAVESAGVAVDSAEIVWVPLQTVEANAETLAQIERLIEAIEDHDDVQRVYTNLA
jgi:transcriptional/translational regulatory protein YebC/TACO1